MNLKIKIDLMKKELSKTESKMTAGISIDTFEKKTSTALTDATSSAAISQRPKAAKSAGKDRDDLAIREEIIKAMQEEIVELDEFIKAKHEATGETDPEDAKLRRKLVRHLSEAKKLFFPKPKVLTGTEREEAQVAVQSWNKFRDALLSEQAVSN